MKQHYVTFLSPGTFVSESTKKPVDEWNIEVAKQMARDVKERHNATPYGFYFSTNERADHELDSKEVRRSGCYYLGGKIETLEEVEARNSPNEVILRANMRNNDIKRIIVNTNSWKVTMPFRDDDTLLDW